MPVPCPEHRERSQEEGTEPVGRHRWMVHTKVHTGGTQHRLQLGGGSWVRRAGRHGAQEPGKKGPWRRPQEGSGGGAGRMGGEKLARETAYREGQVRANIGVHRRH